MTLARSFYSTQTTAFDYLQARAPRYLWGAVLEQAIADIVSGPSQEETRKMSLEEAAQLRRELRAAAEFWVEDDANEPRRFVWVCEQLGLEPSAVRNEIERKKQCSSTSTK